jgi:hypothetical protein
MPSEAIAFDETGERLGLVTEAGGGGMAITLDGDIPPGKFQAGAHLRVTVVEPHNDIRNSLRVEVRYITGAVLGLAFVRSQAAGQ